MAEKAENYDLNILLNSNLGLLFWRHGLQAVSYTHLGPDVNESNLKFTVNNDGNIRFGLGAVKGVGEAAVQSIVEERNTNGPFKGIFDFVQRVNLKMCIRDRLSLIHCVQPSFFANLQLLFFVFTEVKVILQKI